MQSARGLQLVVVVALVSCGGDPFTDSAPLAAAGASGTGGSQTSSSAGAGGQSAGGAAGSSSSGSAGSAGSHAGAAGSGAAGSSSGAAGSSGAADCLKGWRGSSCDTCTPAPAEPGLSCSDTIDCYEAQHCGPSGCTPPCDYASGQTDHSVALAHAVYDCRCGP